MARNKDLNKQMRDERREQILSNALRLFAVNGLAATKISDIATISGFSQGLIYHYFRSKEDIFTELIREAFGKLNHAARELEKLPVPPREKIKIALEELLKSFEKSENFALSHLLIAQATVSDAIPKEAKKIIAAENMVPYEIITRIIIEGQKDGSIKQFDSNDLALVFWTSVKGLAMHRAAHGKKYKTPDKNILMSMFFT
ncbi:MAG: TetR/AcrR family transcriptional regulator [Candidatus Latescibacteria bacterium]|nr:TetR/AcrR family transcriptional regulator [Candidatus Latescibacterota bacterium]